MKTLNLSNLKPALGSKKKSRRVGRGIGSGLGKTCGSGHNGQKSRSGGSIPVHFEGGQMPLVRRVPKSGFNSRLKRQTANIHLRELVNFRDALITVDFLKEKGVINKNKKFVKVYGICDLAIPITTKGIRLSKGARDKVIENGGRVEFI